MPEAFSSIADMRVVIDSSTDKLEAGLTATKNLVSRFASEGSESLSLFDRAIGRTADAIESFKSRAGIILALIEYGVRLYQTVEPYLEKAAQETGTVKQFEEMKASALDLGSALSEGLGIAVDAVKDKTKDAATALGAYTDASREAKRSGTENIDAAYLQAHAFETLSAQMKEASLWIRSFAAPQNQNWDALAYSLDKAEKKLAEIKDKLAHTDGGSLFDQLFGTDLELEKRKAELDIFIDHVMLGAEKLAAVASWKTTIDTSDQDSFLEKLDKQLRGLELRAQTLGMSTTAAAEYIHKAEIMNELDDRNIALTQDQKEELDGLIARWNKATEAINGNAEAKRKQQETDRQNRSVQNAINALERDVANEQLRASSIGQSTAATQALAAEERALLAIRQAGREATPEEIAQIRALGEARRKATEAAIEQQNQLRMINDVGNAVTSNLDSAFRKWTNGSTISVKQMAASILADLAEIEFKAAVLNPLANFLTGSQSGGGGILGQLFGIGGGSAMPSAASWAAGTSIIPAFAGGGDFGPGLKIVGEEGPELMYTGFSGGIIPNTVLKAAAGTGAGSSSPPTINQHITINAQGAYPESIEQIKSTLATVPAQAIAAVQEARDRGVV